ncbi:hypothetical protein R3P38DRAFT_2781487 [Favolaschia claudopus]|uniref:Uncharacterized protein n=1 Tax=Favolaschia claudopus TaxID=2862362 RepID=A0AAW0B5D7_9AGAR
MIDDSHRFARLTHHNIPRGTEIAKLPVLNLCYGFCKEVKELHRTTGEAQCPVELLREIDILYQESLGGILSMVKMINVEKDPTGQSSPRFNGHTLELEQKWVGCRLAEKILDFYEAALVSGHAELRADPCSFCAH